MDVNTYYFLILLIDDSFDAFVSGITTNQVKVSHGTKIWKDKDFVISDISNGLLGTILFQANYDVNCCTISINSNRDAEVFMYLFGNQESELMRSSQEIGDWTLRTGLYLEWCNPDGSNKMKLDRVLSKKIKIGEKSRFTPISLFNTKL